MGSKKNKVKKIFAPSTPPDPPYNAGVVDELVEDLFAELDSRDQTSQQPASGSGSGSAQTAAAAATAAPDKTSSSKSRFKARQVGVPTPLATPFPRQ